MLHNILKIEIKNGYIILSYGYGPPRLARSRTVGEPVGEPTSEREPASKRADSQQRNSAPSRGHSCSRARRSCLPLGPLQISEGEPFLNDHPDFSTSPLAPPPRPPRTLRMTEPTCVPGEPANTDFATRGRCVRATGASGQLPKPAGPSAWTALFMDSARLRSSLGFASAPPQLRAYGSQEGFRSRRSVEAQQARADMRQHALTRNNTGRHAATRSDIRVTCANTGRQAPTQTDTRAN